MPEQRKSLANFMELLLLETSVSSMETSIVQDNPLVLMESSSQSLNRMSISMSGSGSSRRRSSSSRRGSGSSSNLTKAISRWESYPFPAAAGSHAHAHSIVSPSESPSSSWSDLPPVPRRRLSSDNEAIMSIDSQLHAELSQLEETAEEQEDLLEANAAQAHAHNDISLCMSSYTSQKSPPRYPTRRSSVEHDSAPDHNPSSEPSERQWRFQQQQQHHQQQKNESLVCRSDMRPCDSTIVSVAEALSMNSKLPRRRSSSPPQNKMTNILNQAVSSSSSSHAMRIPQSDDDVNSSMLEYGDDNDGSNLSRYVEESLEHMDLNEMPPLTTADSV